MIDINHLRQGLEGLKTAIARKKFECDLDSLVELDKRRREAISEAEQARAGQKAANAEMSQLTKGSPEFLAKVAEMKGLAGNVKDLEGVSKAADEQFQ